MLTTITLVVSLCANLSMTEVRLKKAELEKQFPDAKVTVRIDKSCKAGKLKDLK